MAGMGLRGLGSVREGGAEEDDWSGVLYGGMELMLWLFLGLIGLAYCHMGYMWLRVKLTSGEAVVMGSLMGLPIPIPWFGCAIAYGLDPKSFLRACKGKYGPVFTMYVAGRILTVILDETFHKTFYTAKMDKMLFYEPLKAVRLPEVLGFAFLSSRADGLMKTIKRKFAPQFGRVGPLLSQDIERILEQELGESKSGDLNVWPAVDRLVLVAATRALCFPLATNKQFIANMSVLEALAHELLLRPGILGLPTLWRIRPVRTAMALTIRKEISRRRKQMRLYPGTQPPGSGLHNSKDLLQVMLEDPHARNQDDLLVDCIIGMMFGAVANTNAALALIMSHMATNQSLQDTVREQVLATDCQDPSCPVPIVDNMIKEITRMYAIVLSWRELAVPVQVRSFTLPRGRSVGISSQLSMRNESIFPNPDVFDPHRFDMHNPNAKKGILAWKGFGSGVHLCAGINLAKVEIRLSIRHLVKRVKFTGLKNSKGKNAIPPLQWVSLGLPIPLGKLVASWVRTSEGSSVHTPP
ncbi:hypothetical protein AAMO2058_001210200 [Amorphochlora amoebiformis]